MRRALLSLVLAAGCQGGTSTELRTLLTPARAPFDAVANALQPSCGTLDCHGQAGRNLRLYGGRGLRLAPGDDAADGATTAAEYDANYRSVVGLEPEALDEVVRQGGADPERLSLIRKPRNRERHKGGLQMLVGDPLDRCLTSWLAGATDLDSCKQVSQAERPEPDAP